MDKLLNSRQVAEILGLNSTEALMARYRRTPGICPPAIRIGRRFYWSPSTIEAWLEERHDEERERLEQQRNRQGKHDA